MFLPAPEWKQKERHNQIVGLFYFDDIVCFLTASVPTKHRDEEKYTARRWVDDDTFLLRCEEDRCPGTAQNLGETLTVRETLNNSIKVTVKAYALWRPTRVSRFTLHSQSLHHCNDLLIPKTHVLC